ncbi:MAG: PQQ-like beta-propeller repeat protein [Planctomycetales bacterium]|nr:PQQ-like beta-propeller repeat protein [Planctomycetales bacterium]
MFRLSAVSCGMVGLRNRCAGAQRNPAIAPGQRWVAALVALASGTLMISTTRADWPQWRGAQRDDVSTETNLLEQWPEGGPEQLWAIDSLGFGYSGPAIVGDRLYIMGVRDDHETLLCLNAADGAELWAAEIGELYHNDWGDGPRSTPTVVDDRVYVLGGQGMLCSFDAKSGEKDWSKSLVDDLGGKVPAWGYAESPLVDGDLIVCTPGGDKGAIAALDRRTGEVRWQSADLKDGAHYSSMVSAEINGQPQYVQLLEKRLVGIEPKSGALLWSEDWPGRVAVIPTPIVHGNEVYVTSGYGAGSMLVRIGEGNAVEKVYDDKVMKNHHGGVIRVGDYVYGHSDQVGWVCQEWETGKAAWRERSGLGKGSCTYADGMLYCMDEDEGNVALANASPEGWQEVSRFQISPKSELDRKRGKIWTHPVVCDGRLYIRDLDHLYAYDIEE